MEKRYFLCRKPSKCSKIRRNYRKFKPVNKVHRKG